MAGEPTIEILGSTTRPAEIRFTPAGRPVCNVDVAVNPRRKSQDGTWQEQPAQFFRLTVWGDMAEHVAETLDRSGIRVTARGRLSQVRTYEASNGETRVSVEVDVDSIGPDLRFTSVSVPAKASRGGGQQAPADDPWATAPASGTSEDPPF